MKHFSSGVLVCSVQCAWIGRLTDCADCGTWHHHHVPQWKSPSWQEDKILTLREGISEDFFIFYPIRLKVVKNAFFQNCLETSGRKTKKVWKFCEWRQRSRLCFALDHNWATLINLLPQCSQCRDGKFQKRQTCEVSFFVKGTPLDNFFKNEFENSFKHSTKTSNNKWQNLKKGLQNLGSDMFGRLGADRFCFQVRCFGWEFNLALWKPSWGPWEPWRFWVRPGCRAQRRKWGSLQEGDGETFFEIMNLSRPRKK